MTSVKRDNPDSTVAKVHKSGSNASAKRQSRSVKRTPSKQYRKIIAAEVASGDSYIFADENWESDLHSPVRLISYKKHRGYTNPSASNYRLSLDIDSSLDAKRKDTSSRDYSQDSNPLPKVRRTRVESAPSDACSSDYGVPYESQEEELLEAAYANIDIRATSASHHSRQQETQQQADIYSKTLKHNTHTAADDTHLQKSGISFETEHSIDLSNDFAQSNRRDSEKLRFDARQAVMTTFANGVDSDVTSHEDSELVNDVRGHVMTSSGGVHDLTDTQYYVEREQPALHQDSDSSLSGKHHPDLQAKAQRIVEEVIDTAKQQQLHESDISSSEQHSHDSSADSHRLHILGGIPEAAINSTGGIPEEDAPPLPPRSSLETYIPSPDGIGDGFFAKMSSPTTEGSTDVHARVLADYATSEATEHEERRIERIANADSQVHERVKQKTDESHWEEITADGVRITRDESVQAVKVTRETSITDRQLSTLHGFEHLLNDAPNGFETEKNVQIIEKSERKVESAPAGDRKVTENNEHAVTVQVVTPVQKDNTVKSDITVEVTAPENEHSHSESSDDEQQPKHEETIQPKQQSQTEAAPAPNDSTLTKKDKKSHKQKEIVVDKTKHVTTGTIEKKKAKASNTNASGSGGGFFSKFKRKSEKEKEAEIEHEKVKKAEKEKKEHDRKEKEKAERERKQKEKDEKERKKKEKKKKDSSKRDGTRSDKSDSASQATTPRSPESVDLNKSFNSSLGVDSEQHEVDEDVILPRVIEKSPEEIPVILTSPEETHTKTSLASMSSSPVSSITSPAVSPPTSPPIYYDDDMEGFEEAEIAYPVEVQIQSTPKRASAEAPEPKTQEILIQQEDPKSYTLPRTSKDPDTQPFIHIPPKQSTSQMLAPLHSPDSGISATGTGSGVDQEGRAPGHFVIVAIDFGTTFSGYAFSFTRDPDCGIHMMRKWEGGDPGVINQKTPTTLLLKPNGEFHSFGFAARDFYHDLDARDALKWMYFEKFKMLLHHDANLNKDTAMKAANGKAIPAMTVFCHALRFFKDHALQEITDQSDTKITNEDVKWVITVPAIWKAPAKQFMRQAAYIAGIASEEFPDQLLVALEPEAASIYVRRLRMHQLIPEAPERRPLSPKKPEHVDSPFNMDRVGDEFRDDSWFPHDSPLSSPRTPVSPLAAPRTPTSPLAAPRTPTSPLSAPRSPADTSLVPFRHMDTVASEVEVPGTRYMIVDCGGGTVDITVHEMDARTGKLKELYKATGGPYGSVGVDLDFEALLVEIFGADFIEAFKSKYPVGWVDLMIAFESRKRAANPRKTNPLNVALPFTFIHFYKKFRHSQVETAIRNFRDPHVRWSTQGMLRLSTDAMRRLFTPTLENIKAAIGDVLNNPKVKDVRYLFLVGGFAESGMLQQDVRAEFGHIVQIRIPQDTSLAILKGAVLFGLDPTIVNVRRSRVTYGVGVLNRFQHGKHPRDKLVSKDGIDWCTDILDKFVVTDQPVALGDTVLRSYTPAKPGQKSSVINIYCCENSDVSYVTDRGVTKCGTLCLDLTDVQYHVTLPKRREIQARMVFGDTEIKVSALDVSTGKCVRANVDFLK